MTCLLAAAWKAEESEDDKSEPGSLSRTNSGEALQVICGYVGVAWSGMQWYAVLWKLRMIDVRECGSHLAASEALSQAQTVG
jgi:hypothetical protein